MDIRLFHLIATVIDACDQQPSHGPGHPPTETIRVVVALRRFLREGCKRKVQMTPLCKVDVTLPGVRGASEVHDAGGVDEQEGIRSARSSAGRSVWPSACRGRLRATRPEAAAGVSVAGRFEARGRGQPGFKTTRPAESAGEKIPH